MGVKCSCRLTCSPVDSGDKFWLYLSLQESVLSLVALECSSVETKGVLPVDCTLTIMSIKGLLKIKKYSVSALETTYIYLGSQTPFITYLL